MNERQAPDQLSISFGDKKIDPSMQEAVDERSHEPTGEEARLAKEMLPVEGKEVAPISRAEARRLDRAAQEAREALRRQFHDEDLFVSSKK